MNIKFGFRNILKNKRRSFITMIAITLGFSALNLFGGYIASIYSGLTDQAIIGERLGHLTIVKQDYFTKGKLYPEKFTFSKEEVTRVSSILGGIQGVKLFSPRLDLSGLITNGKVSTIFISEGIRPRDMAVIRGKYADLPGMLDENNPIGGAVSSELASLLGLNKGDDAVLMTTTLDGQINALDVNVADIYNTGNVGTNDKFVLLPYSYAQELYDLKGASRLVVLLDDITLTEPVKKQLQARFTEAGMQLEVKTWIEMSSFYKQVKSLFDMIFLFIFIIVLIIVVMSILNTMGMSVMERTREIGTLRSLGMKRRAIVSIFSTEGMLLAFIGCSVGLAITYFVAGAVNILDIKYVPPSSSDPVLLSIELHSPEVLATFVFMVFLGLLAALMPARKASRMQIVDALGHI